MAELDVPDVIRSGVEPFGFRHHLVSGDENELRLLIDEFSDQPRASDPVDLDVFAGNPFHLLLLLNCLSGVCQNENAAMLW
jgi:hypothetical protein